LFDLGLACNETISLTPAGNDQPIGVFDLSSGSLHFTVEISECGERGFLPRQSLADFRTGLVESVHGLQALLPAYLNSPQFVPIFSLAGSSGSGQGLACLNASPIGATCVVSWEED
jgi:hypothetical protein